jgi:hypothetical protein
MLEQTPRLNASQLKLGHTLLQCQLMLGQKPLHDAEVPPRLVYKGQT